MHKFPRFRGGGTSNRLRLYQSALGLLTPHVNLATSGMGRQYSAGIRILGRQASFRALPLWVGTDRGNQQVADCFG